MKSDIHCQVYFLNREEDSLDKLTQKRLPLAEIAQNSTFIRSKKERDRISKA